MEGMEPSRADKSVSLF